MPKLGVSHCGNSIASHLQQLLARLLWDELMGREHHKGTLAILRCVFDQRFPIALTRKQQTEQPSLKASLRIHADLIRMGITAPPLSSMQAFQNSTPKPLG